MTDPEVLYVDTHEGEPMQFESLCMECMQNVSMTQNGALLIFFAAQFSNQCRCLTSVLNTVGDHNHGADQDSSFPGGRCLLLRV